MSLHTLHIGLLLFPGYQWLDAAGSVDYLNSHSQTMIKQLNVPKAVLDKAPYRVIPSCTYVDCHPTTPLFQAQNRRHHFPRAAPCSYVNVSQSSRHCRQCAPALWQLLKRDLDGLHVCSNKMALKMSAEAGTLNKRVRWVGDRRWIVDGKVWSSAGIYLSAEFARTHFDPEVVELAKLVSEYEPDAAQPDLFAKILEGINLNDSEEC